MSANISGKDQAIDKRKTALSITIFPRWCKQFGEGSSTNEKNDLDLDLDLETVSKDKILNVYFFWVPYLKIIYISQGRIATQLRRGDILNNPVIANFLRGDQWKNF